VLTFMCVLIFLCFLLISTKGAGALLMWNKSHARVLGVGTIILKFTSTKTVLLKNVQHVPFSKRILLVACSCVDMAINLCSSQINVYYQSMGHLLEKTIQWMLVPLIFA
jgi:hypothetical protein